MFSAPQSSVIGHSPCWNHNPLTIHNPLRFLLLNKLTFRPHSGPLFTRAIALAQNQFSIRISLVQKCCVSFSRQSQFAKSHMRSMISSLVLKSDMSERNSSRVQFTGYPKALQPILDSKTRTAQTGTLHALSVYQLLCSWSLSVLFHTNSIV